MVYILRKPHPNGLLIYLACTWIDHSLYVGSKVPLIIDMIPHLQVQDTSPIDIIRTVMKR